MKSRADAQALAETMVGIGNRAGTETVALLTAMDQPLGRAVGNTNEIRESIAVLRNEGPDDLTEITMALGAEMLMLAGVSGTAANARARLAEAVATGQALELFAAVIAAQDGDPNVIDDPSLLPDAPYTFELASDRTGVVTKCDALAVGVAAMRLGAGRAHKEASIDASVGIDVLRKVSEEVQAGDPLALIHYREDGRLGDAMRYLKGAWEVGEAAVAPPLIIDRITG
jgi:thymidine phosphorylase